MSWMQSVWAFSCRWVFSWILCMKSTEQIVSERYANINRMNTNLWEFFYREDVTDVCLCWHR